MGWKDRAFCAGMDTNMFIEGNEEMIYACYKCPVIRECLEYALRTDAQGIWGGTTDIQREEMKMRESLLDGEIRIIWEDMD